MVASGNRVVTRGRRRCRARFTPINKQTTSSESGVGMLLRTWRGARSLGENFCYWRIYTCQWTAFGENFHSLILQIRTINVVWQCPIMNPACSPRITQMTGVELICKTWISCSTRWAFRNNTLVHGWRGCQTYLDDMWDRRCQNNLLHLYVQTIKICPRGTRWQIPRWYVGRGEGLMRPYLDFVITIYTHHCASLCIKIPQSKHNKVREKQHTAKNKVCATFFLIWVLSHQVTCWLIMFFCHVLYLCCWLKMRSSRNWGHRSGPIIW
jgi:hypothetical protein